MVKHLIVSLTLIMLLLSSCILVVVGAKEVAIKNTNNMENETIVIKGHRRVEDLHATRVIVDGGFLEVYDGYVEELYVINSGVVKGWLPVGHLYAKNFNEIAGVEIFDSAKVRDGKRVYIIYSSDLALKKGIRINISNVPDVSIHCHFTDCPWIPLRNDTKLTEHEVLSTLSKYVSLENIESISLAIIAPSITLRNLSAPFLSLVLWKREAESHIEKSVLREVLSNNEYITIEDAVLEGLAQIHFKARNVTIRGWLEIIENNECDINEQSIKVPSLIMLDQSVCKIENNRYPEYHIRLHNSTLTFISRVGAVLYVKGDGTIISSNEVIVEKGNIQVERVVYNVAIQAPKGIKYSVICDGMETSYNGGTFVRECKNPKIVFLWMHIPIDCSFCTYNLKNKIRLLLFDVHLFLGLMIVMVVVSITAAKLSRRKIYKKLWIKHEQG